MTRAIVLALLICVPSPSADAAEALPSAPAPSPTVPPVVEIGSPAVSVPPMPDPDPASPAVKKAGKKIKRKPPTIRLGEKHEKDNPTWQGAGSITAGKTKVKAEGGKLTVGLTGAAFSHSFFGARSVSVASYQLVQEFEIDYGTPEDSEVQVALSGKLEGYVRSENTASACLRLANASVTPVCGGPTVWLAFPSCCVSGTSRELCAHEVEPIRSVLAAGRYVLEANLVLETTDDTCFRGHSEAVFASGHHTLGTWDSHDSPKPDIEMDDFGLTVTFKVTVPPSK